MMLLAGAFCVNTWCALLAPMTFLAASMLCYIPHEERELRRAFGKDHDTYSWSTRRWI